MGESLNLEIKLAESILKLKASSMVAERESILNNLEKLIERKKGTR